MWNGFTHPRPYVNLFVHGRIWVKWGDQQTVPAQLVDLILGELKKRLDVPKTREDDPSVGGTRGAVLDASTMTAQEGAEMLLGKVARFKS